MLRQAHDSRHAEAQERCELQSIQIPRLQVFYPTRSVLTVCSCVTYGVAHISRETLKKVGKVGKLLMSENGFSNTVMT